MGTVRRGVPLDRANPAKAIGQRRRTPTQPRERVATAAELRAVLESVDKAEAEGLIRACEACGLLLVLTSLMRPVDTTRLRWSWIDLDTRLITIPATETKGARIAKSSRPEVAALSRTMAECLGRLQRVSDFVVSTKGGGPVFDLRGPWGKVTELGGLPFEEERLGLYDLKSSAMTLMREAGVPAGHIEAAARHRGQGVTTKHYSFATDTQALSAIDRLDELLAEVRCG